ncbi:MAG: hypothetical protein QM488_02140 [Rhizobiaceae bacterium]
MSGLETTGNSGVVHLNQAVIGKQIATIEHLITLLHDLLVKENKLLQSPANHIPEGTARDKLQLIVQFNRASLEISELVLPEALQRRVQETVQLLEQNEKTLQLRMTAIREVTRTMALAEQEAESDGTYSADPRGWNGI